ncbi:M48 family metallopeptidase [Segatella albensis]|jgi:predicted Zn-dependent protease|uniref:M48 family metallopeptidase n=1 Tax=Segatella albensis TaxID=77768 RepID=UPI00040FE2D1|nr:M48 family metallopeptidase [Segatella albensis]
MKKVKVLVITAIAALTLSACGTTQTVPITGRTHRISSTYDDQQILSLSTQEYQKFMKTAKKSTNASQTAMVQRVGSRLANAVVKFLNNNGYSEDVKNYNWEFNLIQDKEANAWCMPGGKIVVYEGLLPYTQNETCLAIVLGHEIAHAVAKHSAELLTKQQNQSTLIGLGSSVVGAIAGDANVGKITGELASGYAQFRNLKYSRQNELEADHLGLIFAAMAGYDPQQAIPFWQRMGQKSGSGSSDIFSTHPSDIKRIKALQSEMAEAMTYYKSATVTKKTSTKKTPAKKSTKKR